MSRSPVSPFMKQYPMNIFDLKQISSITIILFSIIDIIGSVPVIILLKQKAGRIQSEKASVIALLLMLVFLYKGEELLKFIGLDLPSFALAGSLVIFVMSVEMILGISIFKDEASANVAVVPIAFPLVAGAGCITTILSLKTEYATPNIIVGIALNIVFVYIVLKNTDKIEKILGKSGLGIVRKVFGIIMLALAIKIFANNFFRI